MLSKYTWIATGATQAQVMADIQLILTGTTDVNALSASCDKPNTYILSGVSPATWVSHDNTISDQTIKVLKQQVSDEPSKYKYMKLQVLSTNLNVSICHDWNATTHTATNESTAATYTTWSALATNAGYISIYSDNYITTFNTGTFGYKMTMFMEISRSIPAFNIGTQYTPAGIMHWSTNSYWWLQMTKHRQATTGSEVATASYSPATSWNYVTYGNNGASIGLTDSSMSTIYQTLPDANGNFTCMPLSAMTLPHVTGNHVFGTFKRGLTGINTKGQAGDTFTAGGITYEAIFAIHATQSGNGYTKLWVPRG